jgi:polysaccharide biosynthesis/export protein
MIKPTMKTILFALVILATSCVNTKSATYFVDQGDADLATSNLAPKAKIQTGDLLSIAVTSMSSQATNSFNMVNVVGSMNGNYTTALQTSGYLVNRDGYIKLPYLGDVKAADLNDRELEEKITNGILGNKLMIDPIVTVRHLNFKVTVLGEVGHPLVINVPNEKISILEAIGMAGDLTIYAKRDNVLLIREEEGKKVTRRLNLNSNKILTSPYYYLKTNDVIYVEPNKAKIASVSKSRQILPIIFGALSLGAVVLDRLTR